MRMLLWNCRKDWLTARRVNWPGNPRVTSARRFPMNRSWVRRRVAGGMLLAEIARQNGIRIDSRRVSEALSAIASTYEEPQQVVELYSRDTQLMSGLQSRVLEDQVVDWIAQHAKVSEQKLSFNDVMRPGV